MRYYRFRKRWLFEQKSYQGTYLYTEAQHCVACVYSSDNACVLACTVAAGHVRAYHAGTKNTAAGGTGGYR